ncbi:MAG: Ankyrin [Chthonomonadaceae bacterium]|nr:Ankyrin [Chthonomonadaceae bacterium]
MSLQGLSPEENFQQALTTGDIERIKELLGQGIDVNKPVRFEHGPASPLMIAVYVGKEAMIKLLLEHGADVNQDVRGSTPLSIFKG